MLAKRQKRRPRAHCLPGAKKAAAEAKRNTSSRGNDGGGRFAPGLEYEILKVDAVVLLGLTHSLSNHPLATFNALDGLPCRARRLLHPRAESQGVAGYLLIVSNNITSAASDSSSLSIASSRNASSLMSRPPRLLHLHLRKDEADFRKVGRVDGEFAIPSVHHLVLVRVRLEIQTRQRQHARPRAGRPRTQGKGALRGGAVEEMVVAGVAFGAWAVLFLSLFLRWIYDFVSSPGFSFCDAWVPAPLRFASCAFLSAFRFRLRGATACCLLRAGYASFLPSLSGWLRFQFQLRFRVVFVFCVLHGARVLGLADLVSHLPDDHIRSTL
ncbi:hypothetical protein K438DRAFT_1997511 [Mycena galopus ATCC 62051]|nr:hypothetical protein K438DRAFT_1997511 [Mycena galopus ATCC 62051]